MKNILKISFLISVCFFCCGLPLSVSANVGGGSGKATSPYIDNNLPENSATVTRLRAKESAERTVNFTTAQGIHVYGRKIGIVYMSPQASIKSFESALNGIVNDEKTQRKIDFSIISTITILSNDSNTLTLQLNLFPDITVDELLKAQPTYINLKNTYSRTVKMRIPLWSKDKQPLALVGTDSAENAPHKFITLLNDLPIGQKIKLFGSSYWWAIKSVTDDPAYPHRVIYKH